MSSAVSTLKILSPDDLRAMLAAARSGDIFANCMLNLTGEAIKGCCGDEGYDPPVCIICDEKIIADRTPTLAMLVCDAIGAMRMLPLHAICTVGLGSDAIAELIVAGIQRESDREGLGQVGRVNLANYHPEGGNA